MANVMTQANDLISTLPDDVTKTIMMYLPIRDAVRTSILSSKWRYRWAKLPQLILDETLWDNLIGKHSARITVTMVLFQLLLLHEGPIYKFTLSIPRLESCPEIDSLITFLINNGIEDVMLKMPINECYKLPSSLLTCQHLKHLGLQYCSIGNKFSFKECNRLITLKLWEVNISTEMLGSLISNSPLLEVLVLELDADLYDLEINAPNLKTFSFKGVLKSIRFRRTPLLASVSIDPADNILDVVTYDLFSFFHCLPALQKLHLDYNFVMLLGTCEVPRWLSTTLVYLKDLILTNITLDILFELSFVLCLLRNAPKLKCADIQIYICTADDDTNDVLKILKEEEQTDVMLHELKKVKLQNLTGTVLELEFIKFLLSKSPRLEELLIQPGKAVDDHKGLQILKTVTKFRRASKEAEVIYEEMEKDQA